MLYKRKEENGLNQSHIYIIEGVCCFCCTEGYSMLAFFEEGEKKKKKPSSIDFAFLLAVHQTMPVQPGAESS
jgi:hypothetical protein